MTRPGGSTLDYDRGAFRREVALRCLLVFLESPGDRDSKVHAAVSYADKLIAELDVESST